MASSAKFFLKIYNSTGATYRQTIPSSKILSVPMITRQVNTPAADITIDLALPWDSFGLGSASGINYYDFVKVYAANENNPSGYLVFQGFVTEIELLFDPKTNHIRLRLLPLESILANAFYKNGASFTVSFSAKDCDFMLGAVVDDVNSVQGATYFTKNLATPGKSLTVDLKYNKHLDAVNKIVSFLDQTWYWRTRPNGQVDLQQYAGTPTHKLTIGLHVQALDITLSILDLKNLCVVTWGAGPTDSSYNDATSQSAYGHREEQINDPNIKDSGSSDAAGNGDIARKKNPLVKGIITVNTNYAIETILPGDTCQIFNNTTGGASILSGVMNIVRVEYDGNTAVLHLADYVEIFGMEFTRALGTITQI